MCRRMRVLCRVWQRRNKRVGGADDERIIIDRSWLSACKQRCTEPVPWNKPFQQKLYNRYKRCHNNDKCRHTYGIRNDLTQHGDQHIGQHQYYGCRKSHTDSVDCRSRHRKRRTHSEHQNKGWIFFDQTIVSLSVHLFIDHAS